MHTQTYVESKYLRPRATLQDALPSWKRLYSILFPFCFILNGYSSGFGGLSLGAAIISLFCALSLLFALITNGGFRWGREGCYPAPLILACFFLVSSLAALLTLLDSQYAVGQMLVSLAKVFIWAVHISIVTYLFIDYKIFKTSLLYICLVATLYLVLQYIAWYGASFFLPSIFDLPLIEPYVEEAVNYAQYIASASRSFRPSSFFSEPAFYSNVVLCGLSIHLFDSAKAGWPGKSKLLAAVLSLGLLLSTSTSGIYALFLLWAFFFLTNKRHHMVFNISLSVLAAIAVLVLLNLQSDSLIASFGVFGSTFLNAVSKPLRFMNITRGGKSFAYLSGLTGINDWIGVGFGNIFLYLGIPGSYINTFTYLVFSVGYIGVAGFFIFLFSSLRRNRDFCSIYLIGMYAIKTFSSGIMFNPFGILFLSIAVYRSRYMKAGDHESVDQ